MADLGSAARSKHVTLSAGACDTVTLTGCAPGVIRVTNKSITNPIFFKIVPGGNQFPTDFAAADDDTYYVPACATANVACSFKDISWSYPTARLKLICATANLAAIESIPGTQ